MTRMFSILAGACAAACMWLLAAPASAAAYCPTDESLFGTVQRVNGNVVTVQLPSGHWADVRIESGARMNLGGMTLHPGVYLGAFGCVARSGLFEANEVTLAPAASAYHETITGTIRAKQSGRLIVAENNGQTGAWYVPDVEDFAVGQAVTGIGLRTANGNFYPATVNGRNVAFDTDNSSPPRREPSITLTGTVQRVGQHTIAVYEPSRRTTGIWVVNGTGRFRVGERVTASGTEDRFGHFYPFSVTIL
jgi:hypothetical protein